LSKILEKMTWSEVEETLKTIDYILIPVGSMEQHGPHLPMSTDTIIAYTIAQRLADKLKNAIVLPPIYYGSAPAEFIMGGGEGINVSFDPASIYLINLCINLTKFLRAKDILLINGCGMNEMFLANVRDTFSKQTWKKIVIINYFEQIPEIKKMLDEGDIHAGDFETSLILAIKPELVRTEKISEAKPPYVKGEPAKASSEKGQKLLSIITQKLTELVESRNR